MTTALQTILQHPAIWRGDSLSRPARPSIATGFDPLDRVLPGGGWPVGALTEILAVRAGIGELSLLTPALARLSREQERWLVLVAPPHVPYAPALQTAGVDLTRLVVVRSRSAEEALWATRQSLAAGSASAVLAWLPAPDAQSLRRLQLTAENTHAVALLFRPPGSAKGFSPAALRLLLKPAGNALAVHVLKRRGGPLAAPVLLPRTLLRGESLRETLSDALDCPSSSRPALAGVPPRPCRR